MLPKVGPLDSFAFSLLSGDVAVSPQIVLFSSCGVGTCIKSVSDLCLFRPFCLARDFSGTGSFCGGRGYFTAIQEASLGVQERPAFRCSHQGVFSLHTHAHTHTHTLRKHH